jgi:predicted transcriptional regulator
MLLALMAGKALTATELALEADITTQTASSHLAKLVAGGLLIVRKQGRHKYFQLHDAEVAQLIERLLTISISGNRSAIFTGPKNPAMRRARVCYDHLAGSIGVNLFDSMVVNQYIKEDGDVATLTETGRTFFRQAGVDFDAIMETKRPLCKSCLDWSERKNHLAGILGKWILDEVFSNGWAEREDGSRTIHFNATGLQLFASKYKIRTQT